MLAAVSANDRGKAAERLSHLGCRVPVVTIGELEPLADIVVECAPAKLLPAIAEPFLRAGKTVIVLSAGALLGHPHLVELARERGGQIVVPTGALLGLDAVTAAAEGEIRAVRMITRKPVRGLAGAPYLAEHNIEIADITEPLVRFQGHAARGRGRLSGQPQRRGGAVARRHRRGQDDARDLGGPGACRATPTASRSNSDSASFSMAIENIPSDNPKTGRITALSVIAYLRKLNAPLRVGT